MQPNLKKKRVGRPVLPTKEKRVHIDITLSQACLASLDEMVSHQNETRSSFIERCIKERKIANLCNCENCQRDREGKQV